MNNIYDNGAIMLGNIQDVIARVEKEIKENLDMCFVDQKELLKDLKELRDVDYDMIVAINYDNGMGYSIDYWDRKDKVQ